MIRAPSGPGQESNERTPLLADSSDQDVNAKDAITPLPKASLFALLFCRLVEPIALTVIFPFVNQMVQDTGVDPSQVGYRAGLIESLFTLAQFCTILQWGRLSDRIGRKPVILIGMTGCSLSVLTFGLSRTFPMMVIARVSAGLLNGNVGVLKSSLAELTDHTNEARAFALLPVSWTAGAALGPILGGYLANPAKRYPDLFGDSTFLKQYKYFLPCFTGALFPIIGVISSIIFLKETLSSKVDLLDGEVSESGTRTPVKAPVKVPGVRAVLTKRVGITLANYAMLAFTSISSAGVLPLFMYTPVRLGGLGFTEDQIGRAMSGQAIFTSASQLVLFPPLQRWLGTIGVFRVAVLFYPVAFSLFPLTSHFAWLDRGQGDDLTRTWILLAIQLGCLGLANLAYSSNMLLINASAPSQHALGTLNGVAQMMSSFIRTAGLAIAPSLFAFSIQRHLVGGQLIWIYMVVVSCGLCGTSWLVTDAKAAWRDEVDTPEEQQEAD